MINRRIQADLTLWQLKFYFREIEEAEKIQISNTIKEILSAVTI